MGKECDANWICVAIYRCDPTLAHNLLSRLWCSPPFFLRLQDSPHFFSRLRRSPLFFLAPSALNPIFSRAFGARPYFFSCLRRSTPFFLAPSALNPLFFSRLRRSRNTQFRNQIF